jgi:phosphoribosylformylglycinamidine cyclo-ligase
LFPELALAVRSFISTKRGIILSESKYEKFGASASKAGLHSVLEDAGVSPDAGLFSPVTKDFALDDNFRSFVHCDGAGTKSIIAYLHYRETGDVSAFAGLAQDALVMNLDDVLCIGVPQSVVLSNFISRNTLLIGDAVLSVLIKRYYQLAKELQEFGLNIEIAGGETADCGDVVRTLTVDAVMAGRIAVSNLIRADRIVPGDVVVGLSSCGKASYEQAPNSGIGSNGLTLARHAMLNSQLRERYPEICAGEIDSASAYQGPFSVEDSPEGLGMTVGEALSSPTRTYAPILLKVYETLGGEVHGVIHCTGGGQTKVLRFPRNCKIIKDSLFDTPPLFTLIQRHGKVEWKEMYQVFNMGHRMEIYLPQNNAEQVIEISKSLGVDARIVGRVEANGNNGANEVEICSEHGNFSYSL